MEASNTNAEKPTPSRRGRRLVAWIAIVLLGLPLLAVALGTLALRSSSVRQAILARVSRALEETSGIRARAGDFSLRFRPGVLVLDDVALAAGDAEPFLTAERARVEFDWGDLLGEPTTIAAVTVERPVVDLRQPLPTPRPDDGSPPTRVDVRSLRLVDGRLLGDLPAAEGEPLFTAYEAAGVDVTGSFVDGRIELVLDPTRVTLARAAGEPLVVVAESRVAGPVAGPFRIDGLKVTGNGLRLDAAGEIGTGDDEPLFLRLDLEADPALFVAELEPGAHLKAAGEIDLRTFRGELRASAYDFPSEALQPWLGEAARPGGRPSRLDLDARFKGDPGAERQVTGDGTLAWRQDDRRLADASFTLTDGRLDDSGLVLESLVGDVHAEARDLPAELLRPWVDAATLARFGLAGTRFDLVADATVDAAAPAAPVGRADLTWRRGAEKLAAANARTVGGPAPGVVVAFEATLLPATPGRRHLEGRLAAAAWPELAAGELAATRIELELPDVRAAIDDARGRWPELLADVDPDGLPLTVEGSLTATAGVTGTLDAPGLTLDAVWRPDEASSVTVIASGQPLAPSGEVRVEVSAFNLARLPVETAGLVDGTVTARGSLEEWTAEADLEGAGLRYGAELPAFERLHLVASTDGAVLEVTRLAGQTGETRFTGGGRVELPPLADLRAGTGKIARATVRLDAERPFANVDRVALRAGLDGGVVRVEQLDLETANGPGELAAEIPLGALRAFDVDVDALPLLVADGRIMVDLGFPALDLGDLTFADAEAPPWTTHQVSLTGRVWIEPGDLTAAAGELLVERWLLIVDGYRLEVADDPILIALASRKLEVLPVTIEVDGRPVDVVGTVSLTPGWTLEDGFTALVGAIEAHAEGAVEAGLLTPFLGGGAADGPLEVTADVAGTLDDLDVRVVAEGPDARLLYMTPYVTQLTDFHVEAIVDGDEIRLPDLRAAMNGGEVTAVGARTAAGDWTFHARFDDVRYRFDYGLTTQLDGRLELALPAEGRGRLAGEIVVERGVLRRSIDLQREILAVLNAPPDVTAARADADAIELDVVITTTDGVRIKNNLADLKADWSTITVQGTLGNPAIDGRIEAAPGGRVTIFGRAAPSDQVALVFSGEPGVAPDLELPTVTAFQSLPQQDPSTPQGPFEWHGAVNFGDPPSRGDGASYEEQLGLGIAGYYSGQIAERLSERLGTVRIQPVLLFAESGDPAAKVVISRDLSRTVALAAAIDLRDSQDQTYLLDVHDLRGLPRMTFQAFTNEAGNEGGTVQHTIELGGGKRDEANPRLRKIRIDGLPEEVSVRAIRRAVSYAPKEPLGDGADFDVEVDVAEELRRRGYPDAEVAAVVVPYRRDEADVVVTVEAGQHVVFEFEGDTPPAALRRSITASYRSDFYEPAALIEIREGTVAALRGLGYLEPQVEVEVEPATDAESRVVRITAVGGPRVRIQRVVFAGVEEATVAILEGRLASETARVELAAGLPEADEWLLTQMRSLGFPEATIASRQLAENGRELRLTLAPGPRQTLRSVAIAGLDDVDRTRYQERLPLAPGDVPRTDRVAAGKYLIQNALKRQGHAEARVRSVMRAAEDDPDLVDLVYEVEPGSLYRIEEVKVQGLQATRPRWARNVTRLEDGAPLEPSRIGEARRRLLGTRLFRSVRSSSDLGGPDDSTAVVTFNVEEIPRYQLAYGVRWENSEGASAVVDAVDRNFLGRGMTLGLRGLYSEDDQAGRFYLAKSGFLGRRMALESYLETRRIEGDITADTVTDVTETSVQVSFPIRRLTSRAYARYRRQEVRDPFLLFPIVTRFPFVGWQVIYDTRNDVINPDRGFFASTDLSASGDYIGSDSDFVRLFTQLHWHRPAFRIGRHQLTWSQAYRVGLLTTKQEDFALEGELFEAGGEHSVRGYPTDSLVLDPEFPPPSPFRRDGKALLVINQELRFPIWSYLSGLVFFDAGNAWAERSDFGTELFTSVGVGLRADTPFGLFRFDLALPLDRREGDPEYKTYLGIGHAF